MKTARNSSNKDSFSDVISTMNLHILGWHHSQVRSNIYAFHLNCFISLYREQIKNKII